MCMPFLCAWTDPGYISIEICSFYKYATISNPTTIKEGAGHSFVIIYNNTSSNITVGYYTLSPNDCVSVGLWQKGAGGGSSSGGSSGNSSSGSSSGADYNGIYYNKELYYYNFEETMIEPERYETNISTSTLAQISNKIIAKNGTYSLITYNCAHFATEIWNMVDSSANWYTGWFRGPKALRTDIKNKYNGYTSTSSSLEQKTSFRHYLNSASYVETNH